MRLLIIFLFLFSCSQMTEPGDLDNVGDILFIKRDKTVFSLGTINSDGTDEKTIISHVIEGDYFTQRYVSARWSPDKKRIALVGGPRDNYEYTPVWILDNSGTFEMKVAYNGSSVVWLDNNRLLYKGSPDESVLSLDIHIFDLKNNQTDLIYDKPDSIYFVLTDYYKDSLVAGYKYAPYKEKIPFELIFFNINTYSFITITNSSDFSETWPRISNSKEKILFMDGDRTGSNQITNFRYMDIDGGNVQSITSNEIWNYNISGHFTWSPDDKKIAYSFPNPHIGYPDYNYLKDIFIYDLESQTTDTLTNTAQDSIVMMVMDWKKVYDTLENIQGEHIFKPKRVVGL